MSTYCYLESTSFTLVDGAGSIPALEALIEEHMEDYSIEIDAGGDGQYSLSMDGSDVGDSFPGRIESLVKAMAPLLKDCFKARVRTDAMNDERDSDFVGGPTQEAIEAYYEDEKITGALECLNVEDTAVSRSILALLKDKGAAEKLSRLEAMDKLTVSSVPLTAFKDVYVFATVEGGVLQGVVATHPVRVFCIDFDTDGCDKDQLVDVTMGRTAPELAEMREIFVDSNAPRCEELHKAMLDHVAGSDAINSNPRPRPA